MIELNIETNINEYKIKCEKNTNLKEVLKKEDINFIFPCGGNGNCGNCKIKVFKGVEKPTKLEEIKLTKKELNENIRLACCVYVKEDMHIGLNEITEYNFLDL